MTRRRLRRVMSSHCSFLTAACVLAGSAFRRHRHLESQRHRQLVQRVANWSSDPSVPGSDDDAVVNKPPPSLSTSIPPSSPLVWTSGSIKSGSLLVTSSTTLAGGSDFLVAATLTNPSGGAATQTSGSLLLGDGVHQ